MAYVDVVLADTPLGYWRLGEATGTTAVDSSGNGYDAPLTGSYTLGASGLVAGDTNKAITFGGGKARTTASLPSTIRTVEALISPTSRTNSMCVVDRYGTGSTAKFHLYVLATTGNLGCYINNDPSGAGSAHDSGVQVPLNKTSHVAMTVTSAGVLTLYLNGVAVYTATPGDIIGNPAGSGVTPTPSPERRPHEHP